MKVSITQRWDKIDLGFMPPEIRTLCEKSDKVAGGYITLTASLPRQQGTDEQNRAFHSLVGEYWRSGCSSDASFEDIKTRIKLQIGGAEFFAYYTDRTHVVESVEQIPTGVKMVIEIPKSWSDFTKEERTFAIDSLMKEMVEAGVNSKKFDEIVGGMSK